MYSDAETFIGQLFLSPSAHKYSNKGPADMIGQVSEVQYSVMQPKTKAISLKNSIVLTANHSLRLSP